MPRINKSKESIVSFAHDAIKIINENLNLSDLQNREDKPIIESDGWYYYLHKSIANVKPEIRIRRYNYNPKTMLIKDTNFKNYIEEQAWIYKAGMNCYILGVDDNGKYILGEDPGFIIDGFSVQDYKKYQF
jgi:hypothetical protein